MNEKNKIDEFLIRVALEGNSYPKVSRDLDVDRKLLTQWEKDFKTEYQKLAKIRQLFLRKKFEKITPREFLKWYNETDRKCYYCRITEPEIKELIDNKQIHTKRITTRGRQLEIERREPNEKYDNVKNLVYCCYWCNNAKSDEFSAAEFKYIGQLIMNIWNYRLRAIREKLDHD